MNNIENNDNSKKDSETFIKGIMGCGLVSLLIGGGAVIGLGYVVIHFVAKIW